MTMMHNAQLNGLIRGWYLKIVVQCLPTTS